MPMEVVAQLFLMEQNFNLLFSFFLLVKRGIVLNKNVKRASIKGIVGTKCRKVRSRNVEEQTRWFPVIKLLKSFMGNQLEMFELGRIYKEYMKRLILVYIRGKCLRTVLETLQKERFGSSLSSHLPFCDVDES